MQIVKAEILWTRQCPLGCPYCAMVDGRSNTQPLPFWKKTAKALSELGCGFAAFYGAEPLVEDIEKLGATIKAFEDAGIKTTIITSGCVPHFIEKMDKLYNYGLRSLSMSYDIVPLGSASRAKTNKAIDCLCWWLKKKNVRDAAAITTLTRTNYRELPQSIVKLSEMGIWTFFDIIHADRGQEGCKVRNTPEAEQLLFKEDDYIDLKQILIQVSKLKMKGYKCHSSDQFLALLCRENFRYLKEYDWKCSYRDSFPAWLTIDCDGRVYPCDDFQPRKNCEAWFSDTIDQNFEQFAESMKEKVSNYCSGCLWNTHFDAHLIKEGNLAFSNYVHTQQGAENEQ